MAAVGLCLVTPMAVAAASTQAQAQTPAAVPDLAPDSATATAWARQANKPVVDDSRTSEVAQTTANPDGSWTLTEYVHPVRVKRAGAWTPVDTSLVHRADGSIGPKATTLDVALNRGGVGSAGTPIVTVASGDRKVGLSWPADLPAPVLAGDTATYPNVYPDVDLRVRATTQGYQETVVIRTPRAAADPRLAKITFGLFRQNTTVSRSADGVRANDSSGKPVFQGTASAMWDSAGAVSAAERGAGPGGGRHSATMGFQVRPDSVTISPDRAFLADPATTYPVVLDPSSYCTTCTIQAHDVVQSSYGNALNYNSTAGDLSDLKAGYENYDAAGTSRTYVQMNTHDIAGATIHSATLDTTVIHTASCAPGPGDQTDLNLSGAIGPGTTWNAQPAMLTFQGSINVSNCHDAPGVTGQFPATDAATQAANNRWDNVTLQLRANNEGDVNAWRRFDLNPKLQVDYDFPPNAPTNLAMQNGAVPCVQGANRPWVFTQTPELQGTVSDPDGGTLQVEFAEASGPAGSSANLHNNVNSMVVTGTPGPNQGATSTYTIPAGWITSDGTYNWSMAAWDTELWSPWVGNCEFTVDTAQPLAPSVSMTGTAPVSQGDRASFSVSVGMATAGLYDIDHFIYSTDGSEPQTQGSPTAAATQTTDAGGNLLATATLSVTATQSQQNYVHVRAVNKAGTPGRDQVCVASTSFDAPSCSYHVLPVTSINGLVGAWGMDALSDVVNRSMTDTSADTITSWNSGATTPPQHPAAVVGASNQAYWSQGYNHGNSWTHNDTNGYSARTRGSLGLDGTAGWAHTTGAVLDTTKSFTVGAWVYLANGSTFKTVLSQEGNQTSPFMLQYSFTDNKWAFRVTAADQANPGDVRVLSTDPPQFNAWTHLTGTYDASTGTITLYVNGVRQGSSVATSWAATGNFDIGATKWNGATTDYFPGEIDDVQAWQRVLSPDDVHALANTATPLATYGLAEGCAPALQSNNPAIPTLQSDWEMDNGSGAVATDSSGFGNDLALTGTTSWVAGHQGGAVHFDGATGYGSAASAVDSTKDFTVSAWVNVDDLNGFYPVFAQHGTKQDAFQLRYSKDVGQWVFGMTSADDNSVDNYTWASGGATNSKAGSWTMVTGVYDTNAHQLRLYLNGKLADWKPFTSAWNATAGLRVGATFGFPMFFKGAVDQAKVWQKALTDDEVAALNGSTYADTTNGATATASGGANLGTDPNSTGQATACAAKVDGSGTGLIDAPRPAALRTDHSYTVEAWVKHAWTATDIAANGTIDPYARTAVAANDTQFVPFALGYRPYRDGTGKLHGKWTFFINQSPGQAQMWIQLSDADVVDNQWTHLVGIYDAVTHHAELHVADHLEAGPSDAIPSATVTGYNSAGDVLIGRDTWTGTAQDPWYGGIAGVRLYSGVAARVNNWLNDMGADDPTLLFK